MIHIETDLHSACKIHPCMSEIHRLLLIQHQPTSSRTKLKPSQRRDTKGKLPLHTCENGVSPGVIKLLLSDYESACMISDYDGKLPIHHFCENYVRNSNPEISLEDAEDDFMEILELLVSTSYSSLLKLDKNGLCPLEYAIYSEMSCDIIHSIRCAMEKLLKSMASCPSL